MVAVASSRLKVRVPTQSRPPALRDASLPQDLTAQSIGEIKQGIAWFFRKTTGIQIKANTGAESKQFSNWTAVTISYSPKCKENLSQILQILPDVAKILLGRCNSKFEWKVTADKQEDGSIALTIRVKRNSFNQTFSELASLIKTEQRYSFWETFRQYAIPCAGAFTGATTGFALLDLLPKLTLSLRALVNYENSFDMKFKLAVVLFEAILGAGLWHRLFNDTKRSEVR